MRPASDVDAILPALELFCNGVRDLGHARLHLFGDRQDLLRRLPMWSVILDLEDAAPYDSPLLTVHVGVNYSGQGELFAVVEALRELGLGGLDRPLLDLVPSGGVPALDLLIRSGGQQRLSGFLPFQAAYAELWFTSTLWPDFDRTHFDAALHWYSEQERRLGE
jgi:undecaprenyl diphosphate synthase